MLSHQAAKGDCSAKELYTDIIQYKFIAITHLMMDVLPYLARVSKVIQNVNSLTTEKQTTKFSSAIFQKMLSPSCIILRIQRLEGKQCRSRSGGSL